MNTLVVYDSAHGNTKTIAEAIGQQFNPPTTAVMPVSVMNKIDITQVNLLVVGSPTYGGRPTDSINKFLSSIPDGELTDKKIASFDTRLLINNQRFGLRLLMKIIGYAAPKIEKVLIQKGGEAVAAPMGFGVITKDGPLAKNEVERAVAWSQTIADSLV